MSTLEESDVTGIRRYELRLLRCTLTPSPSSNFESSDDLINKLLSSIECGNYAEALTSQSSKLVFQLNHNSPPSNSSGERFYSELVDRAESFITDTTVSTVEQTRRATLVLCIAVAAFLGFTQCNFTG